MMKIIDNEKYRKALQQLTATKPRNTPPRDLVVRTFLVLSQTNYGETVAVVNACSIEDVHRLVVHCCLVWAGYEVREIDVDTIGISDFAGG
jgi:hypothetical protein